MDALFPLVGDWDGSRKSEKGVPASRAGGRAGRSRSRSHSPIPIPLPDPEIETGTSSPSTAYIFVKKDIDGLLIFLHSTSSARLLGASLSPPRSDKRLKINRLQCRKRKSNMKYSNEEKSLLAVSLALLLGLVALIVTVLVSVLLAGGNQ
jgi:hypothetical protein